MAIKIQKHQIASYRKLTPRQGSMEYAKLRETVLRAGILDRSYLYYSAIALFSFVGFFASLYQYIYNTNVLVLVLWALVLTFFIVQVGGLVHDAGHRAVFQSTKWNDIFGSLASALITFSYTNWKVKHNAHHAHVNEDGNDPDVEIPFSFTSDRYKHATGLTGFIRKHQMWLYYPLGSLSVLSMRFKALFLYRQWHTRQNALEFAVFLVGVLCWYVFPFAVFPFWKALLFIVVTNSVTGFYILNIFAPNHKGMPQLGRDVKFSFLEQQIMTARNIYGHWLTDYVYLGLNYQIEHHLFPNCPRNKLKLISPYVKALCRKYSLSYTQMSVINSNRFILTDLMQISRS